MRLLCLLLRRRRFLLCSRLLCSRFLLFRCSLRLGFSLRLRLGFRLRLRLLWGLLCGLLCRGLWCGLLLLATEATCGLAMNLHRRLVAMAQFLQDLTIPLGIVGASAGRCLLGLFLGCWLLGFSCNLRLRLRLSLRLGLCRCL